MITKLQNLEHDPNLPKQEPNEQQRIVISNALVAIMDTLSELNWDELVISDTLMDLLVDQDPLQEVVH